MAGTYTPKSGSREAKLLEMLQHMAGQHVPVRELAEATGVNRTNVATILKPSIEAGLVERVGSGSKSAYMAKASPTKDAPADGKLRLEAYDDGDLHVVGGTITTENGMLLTRDQLRQLLEFVTRPLIALPIATGAA